NAVTAGGAPNNETLDGIGATVTTNKKGKSSVSYSLSSSAGGYGWNGGGLGVPNKMSVDGANNVWIANGYYQTVSGWSQTQSAWLGVPGIQGTSNGSGYSNGSTGNTLSACPDPSGNLWTANTDGTVTELIGLAAPTASPIYPGLFGTMP